MGQAGDGQGNGSKEQGGEVLEQDRRYRLVKGHEIPPRLVPMTIQLRRRGNAGREEAND